MAIVNGVEVSDGRPHAPWRSRVPRGCPARAPSPAPRRTGSPSRAAPVRGATGSSGTRAPSPATRGRRRGRSRSRAPGGAGLRGRGGEGRPSPRTGGGRRPRVAGEGARVPLHPVAPRTGAPRDGLPLRLGAGNGARARDHPGEGGRPCARSRPSLPRFALRASSRGDAGGEALKRHRVTTTPRGCCSARQTGYSHRVGGGVGKSGVGTRRSGFLRRGQGALQWDR